MKTKYIMRNTEKMTPSLAKAISRCSKLDLIFIIEIGRCMIIVDINYNVL